MGQGVCVCVCWEALKCVTSMINAAGANTSMEKDKDTFVLSQ